MVKPYSLKNDGNVKISSHFTVQEFRCKDGSDAILIDDRLVAVLELIREHFGKSATITSGYRTESYNKKCGGAAKSQHLYGTAADISIAGVDYADVCKQAETILSRAGIAGGVGLYPGRFAHIDVRADRARWRQDYSGGPQYNVSGFGGETATSPSARATLRMGSKGKDVEELQTLLNAAKYDCGKPDGIFGAKTETALKGFQTANKLTADGICGKKTWEALSR